MHKRIQYIRCKQCKSNIALMTEVFSLKMAEGTSGNYVNEYGVVHQTTTLKTSLEGAIVCVGGAETRDSWFDGYSWTISYCGECLLMTIKFSCLSCIYIFTPSIKYDANLS